MSVSQRRDHLTQDFVELVSTTGARRSGTELRAFSLPVDAMKFRIVVTILDRFPGVVEDRKPPFDCCCGNQRRVVTGSNRELRNAKSTKYKVQSTNYVPCFYVCSSHFYLGGFRKL